MMNTKFILTLLLVISNYLNASESIEVSSYALKTIENIVSSNSNFELNNKKNLFLPPIAQDDFDTAEINTPLIVSAPGVLANDTDPDNDTIEVVSFSVLGSVFRPGDTANLSQGAIQINTDGSFTFTPNPNYVGDVTPIRYSISDGSNISQAFLFLTTERITNLLSFDGIGSCNQGYGSDGNYHIQYILAYRNESTARDYHPTNLIRNINPTIDLDAVFGANCVVRIDNMSVSTEVVQDFINNPYPLEFNPSSINPDFLDGNSNQLFSTNAINTATLYPRQRVFISFCIVVNPFCNGRPNPTPSGSGVDFNAQFDITSSIGSDNTSLFLSDFHTTESQIIGSFRVPEISPEVNPDGTYDFTNTVTLTNVGSTTANNINFNMGLGGFLNNGLQFNTLSITQVSGTPVNINTNFNGDNNTLLLNPNNSLAPGESVELEVFYLIGAIGSSAENYFNQLGLSQTQGVADGLDESLLTRDFTFVLWEDDLGAHTDRYYNSETLNNGTTIDEQCLCTLAFMEFFATSSNNVTKTISNTESIPNGILEHEAITFDITITNTSAVVNLDNLQISENLGSTCGNTIVALSNPQIISSTATTNPTLNTSFNGISDSNLFTGNNGLLMTGEGLTVRFEVIYNEDCIGTNTVEFTGRDPFGNTISITGSASVDAFTDTDDDGISNAIDIDDDNDGIPDVNESNGADPIDDNDNDFIPNYRDTDFGPDLNNDGIVDSFDFDLDGIPNHFDLDADNDGIFDIVEAGHSAFDTDRNGQTDNPVGANGLDNNLETNDGRFANINYSIADTDSDTLPNFNDIDADGDGITDTIEAQLTNNFTPPNNTNNTFGIDTAYPSGLQPIDTDNDTLPDYIDTNTDGDIRDDIIEGWDEDSDGTPERTPTNSDVDNDGLDDGFDNNTTALNPSNNQTPLDFPNADYIETEERDWRELIALIVVISDASNTEGEDLTFNIDVVSFRDNSIAIPSATPIIINLNTRDSGLSSDPFDLATAPFDYNPITNTPLIIPALTTNASFTINSLQDIIFERNEQFSIEGTLTSNNTINTDVLGIGTIIDDELPPTFDFNDTIANEGDDLIHILTLSHPSSTPTVFSINSINSTAIAPRDYTSLNTELTIEGTIDPNNANTTLNFNIVTLLDNLNEPDEEDLNIRAVVNSNNTSNQNVLRTDIIIDIDPNPLVVINDDTVTEGNILRFTISLLNQNNELMANYAPIDLDLETIDVSSSRLLDYNPISLSVTIPALSSEITQSVTTIDDNLNEDTETLNMVVTINSLDVFNTSPEVIGIGTIKDNDIPNLFTPNSDGFSDEFRIAGLDDFPNFKLQIMDRWGGEVYNYNNNGNTTPDWWDGTQNGEPVVEGVYFYSLDFNDGTTPIKTGFIQLAR